MSMRNSKEYKFKVVLLGEGAVGKSSLVLRYVENKFSSRHLSTIQASYQTRTIDIDNCKVELNIWDTAGQEKYHALGPIYYRGSNGVLLIYDVTDQRSFERVKLWIRELRAAMTDSAVLMIVGNKIDLESSRNVKRDDAEKYAIEVGAIYTETSAMENIGISEAFEKLAEKMIENYQENSPPVGTRTIQLVDDEELINSSHSRRCCRS